MKLKREKIGIVIPAANESKSIEALSWDLIKNINRLKINAKVFFVVDLSSQDDTRQILETIAKKSPNISVIFEPKNKNVADARIRGFKEAISQNCDFIIEMDCGFSHLPSELWKFIEGYREGYDCVLGVRNLWSKNYKVPLYRRVYSIGGTILSNILLGTNMSDTTSGYEGFRKKVLETVIKSHILSTDHFFQTEIRYRVKDFNNKEVFRTYTSPTPRIGRSSLYNSFAT